MIERLMVKFHDFMVKVVGVNWRTTISGLVAVIATFVLSTPEAIDFLPDTVEHWLELCAKIAVVVAGGSFAILAKDKSVTGGKEPATEEAKKRIGMS
jgi:cytosine/uracil/thiamine/allantoin permease